MSLVTPVLLLQGEMSAGRKVCCYSARCAVYTHFICYSAKRVTVGFIKSCLHNEVFALTLSRNQQYEVWRDVNSCKQLFVFVSL